MSDENGGGAGPSAWCYKKTLPQAWVGRSVSGYLTRSCATEQEALAAADAIDSAVNGRRLMARDVTPKSSKQSGWKFWRVRVGAIVLQKPDKEVVIGHWKNIDEPEEFLRGYLDRNQPRRRPSGPWAYGVSKPRL